MARRRRDPEGTRVAILTAARRLLAEQDFSTVSIRDIAAAAGVSHGVVQHHFGTRRQLIAAIIQAEVQEFPYSDRHRPELRDEGRSAALANGVQGGHGAFPRLRASRSPVPNSRERNRRTY